MLHALIRRKKRPFESRFLEHFGHYVLTNKLYDATHSKLSLPEPGNGMKCILVHWSKNKFKNDKDIMIDGMQIESPSEADRSVRFLRLIFSWSDEVKDFFGALRCFCEVWLVKT